MSSNNERFVRAYEELTVEINRRAHMDNSTACEIDAAAARDKAVANQKPLLRYIREVRHALQHPKGKSAGPPIVVSDPFLQEVLDVVGKFCNPKTAKDICVPRGKLFTAQLTSNIRDVADEMRAKYYSHVPILDDADVVIGVFNEAAIFDYFSSNEVIDAARHMLIEDIVRHCRLDTKHTETFKFMKPSMRDDEIIAAFTKVGGDLTRVGALFVTPSGKPTESITGMITPWDVLAR